MKDQQIEYFELRPIFDSAYRNNGGSIEFSLTQVAMITGRNRSEIATILRHYIKKLNDSKRERSELNEA